MAKKFSIGATIGLDGEKQYRQAVSGINSDMKVLTSQMKLSKSEFGGQANSVEALTDKNKILNEQVEKQREKVKLLNDVLERSKQQYGENDTRTDKWKISLNNAQVELNKLDGELVENKKYLKEAKDSTDKTSKSIDEYGKEVKEAEDKTLTFGDVLKANLASDVIIGGVKALAREVKNLGGKAVNSVKDTAAYADTILTMSKNTGLATSTLQELSYMSELIDVDLEMVTTAMARNIKAMGGAADGTAKYSDAYKKLGVKVTDSNGKLRDSESVFWETAEALKGLENATERDAASMELFGRSAQDLNSLILTGKDGVNAFAKEANDMGYVLEEDVLNSLGETDDAFQRMEKSMDVVKRQFGIALAPAVTTGAKKITGAMTDMSGSFTNIASGAIELLTDGLVWVIDNADLVVSALGGIAAGFGAFKTITAVQKAVTAIQGIGGAASGSMSLVDKLVAGIKSNPWAVAATAIGVVTAAIILISANSKAADSDVTKLIKNAEGASENISDAIESSQALREELDAGRTDFEAGASSAELLADQIFELSEKTKLSTGEQELLNKMIEQLNEILPEANIEYDKNTGKIKANKEEIYALITAKKEEYMVQAAAESLIEIGKEMYEVQKAQNEAKEYGVQIAGKLSEAESELTALLTMSKEEFLKKYGSVESYNLAISRAQQKVAELAIAEGQNGDAIKKSKDELNKLSEQYKYAQDYIKNTKDIDKSRDAFKGLAGEVRKAKDEIKKTTDSLANPPKINYSKWNSIGSYITLGISNGMTSQKLALENSMLGLLSGMESKIKKGLGIKSPSRKYAEIGKFMAQGIGVGWGDEIPNINSQIADSVSGDFKISTSAKNESLVTGLTSAIINAFSNLNLAVKLDRDEVGKMVNESLMKGAY